jgi:hypothetical protein
LASSGAEPLHAPGALVPTPGLSAYRRWLARPAVPSMREGYAVARDAIFGDFFETLKRAPG